MGWQRPSQSELWRALDVYLQHAYGGVLPGTIRARIEALQSVDGDGVFDSPVIERDPAADPLRLKIRLGNRFYPHMKLVIERSPDGRGYLFRADTHDRHACPPATSREYGAFCELMARNQAIALAIETAWEQSELPTFKSYLRRYLEQRKADT